MDSQLVAPLSVAPSGETAHDAQVLAGLLQRLMAPAPPQGTAPGQGRLRTVVLWVYRDHDRRWCVREEGGRFESAFASRERAAGCARAAGRVAGSYRLFLQLNDGRVIEEYFNLDGRPSPDA